MLKKILLFVLVVAMLTLSSCKVVEVIDHGNTQPEETTSPTETTPPKEYDPWGVWYSYEASNALELTQDSNKAKLYFLTTGYYEYNDVAEVDCVYDGNTLFTLSYQSESVVCVFDKLNDTLTISGMVYTHQTVAPTEHPTYALPNYAELDPSSYITIGEIDFDSIAPLVFEVTPYKIANTFYGGIQYAPFAKEISRPAQEGDCVKIDYCGKLDGVAFQGGTANGVSIFISEYDNKYIPGFIDGIIGHSVGETFDVNLTFPENYHATDLAGKAVVFTMTLHGIYDLSLTDEQVNAFKSPTYTTYADWLKGEQLAVTEELFSNALLKATTTKTPIPADTYLYYYQQAIDYYYLVAYYYGIDIDYLMYYYGLSETILMQRALNQATYNMALFVLMEQEGLSWTDEEFTQKYDAYVAEYLSANKDASQEDAQAYADGMKGQIELDLTEEKVLVWSFGKIFPSENE